jgi:predicted porin
MRRFSALILALATVPAFGQELRGPYIGLGIDQIDYSDTIYRIDMDDTAMSQKLIAGFRFNDTLAFEAHYAESDEFVTNASGWVQPFTSPIGPIGGPTTARFAGTFDSYEVRALAHQGAWVLGVGYFSADSAFTLNGTSDWSEFGGGLETFAGGAENSDSGFSIIIGGQWDIGDWGIRAEYSYYDLEANADAFSLGVGMQYRF